jgi:hypothetical protein
MNIKAIETQYKGYRFRSRLEARWAVFFDALGVEWEYEKEGFDLGEAGYYLPDFWLPVQKVWVEVKGDKAPDAAYDKAMALSKQSEKMVFIVEGSIGEHTSILIHAEGENIPHALGVRIDLTRSPGIVFRVGAWERANGWTQIYCPICEGNYIHFGSPKSYSSKDDYTVWGGRGGAIKIGMSCESGHYWTMVLGAHKGEAFFTIEDVYEETDELAYWLSFGDTDRRDKAIEKARSARFEFGEQG